MAIFFRLKPFRIKVIEVLMAVMVQKSIKCTVLKPNYYKVQERAVLRLLRKFIDTENKFNINAIVCSIFFSDLVQVIT